MKNKISILDFETTGFGKDDLPTEAAYLIFDYKEKKILDVYSSLITPIKGMVLPQKVQELTGITDDLRERYGKSMDKVFRNILADAFDVDAIVAHNAPFDRRMFYQARDYLEFRELIDEPYWICSMSDIAWPVDCPSRKLSSIAAFKDIAQISPHRAIFDVLTVFQLIRHMDIEKIIKEASEDYVLIKGRIKSGEIQKAQALGFFWHKEFKQWVRKFRKSELGKTYFPFAVEVINEAN